MIMADSDDSEVNYISNELLGSVEMSENKTRWAIVGMCSFSILPPVMRSYITPVLTTLYKKLKKDHTVHIDRQSHPDQYKSHGGVFLNYEGINGNKSNHGKRYDKYDYSVRNAEDLSKLFVDNSATSYTDFQECDLATLLRIITRVDEFHPTVKTWADEVRGNVRNAFCHEPNICSWNREKFEIAFSLMKNLVKSLQLPNTEVILNDISKWEKVGTVELDTMAFAEFVLQANTRDIEASMEKLFKKLEQMVKAIVERDKFSVIYSRIGNWEKDQAEFVKTDLSSKILNKISKWSCVTITGSFGTGKTCTMRYVAQQMQTENYIIVPITEPFELKHFFRPDQKTLFVIDDFCGVYSLNKTAVDCWKQYSSFIENLLMSNNVKIIAACRLQVYRDKQFRPLPLSHECNLSEEEYHLTQSDAREIASRHINDDSNLVSIAHFYSHHSSFPLLCKRINAQSRDFTFVFESHLKEIYEGELKKLNEERHYSKIYTLALCVIFNNKISLNFDNIETNIGKVLMETSKACLFRGGVQDLVHSLHDECDTLLQTFLNKENNTYMAMNQKMFNSLIQFYIDLIPGCLIMNGNNDLIISKFQVIIPGDSFLQHIDNKRFLIKSKYHSIYFERLLKELLNGNFHEVLKKSNSFQSHLMRSIMDIADSKDMSLLEQLARTVDISTRDTFLSMCCMMPECRVRSGKNIISWCLDMGIDVNQTNSSGQTPLFIASKFGNISAVDILLKNNANVDKSEKDGFSPLYIAIQYGQTAIVKRLLCYNANVNQCNLIGSFPLAVACRNNRLEIFKLLLEKGAEIDKQINNGRTSLSFACEYGCNEIVQQLVDLGACVNIVGDEQQSPLVYACSEGFQQIIKTLIENNANVNLCNIYGTSPLHTVCHAKKGDHIAIAKYLLENNADVNATDFRNLSVLYDSCQSGHFEMVKLLLEFGADVNLRCFESDTPLFAASYFGFKEIVEILLDHKADVNIYGKYGQMNISPLHVACKENHTSIVEILLRSNAKFDEVNDESLSPLAIACYNGNIETVKLLLDYKADVNNIKSISPLVLASQNGHKAIVNLLLDNNVEINSCNIGSGTALYLACQNGFTEIVKILLGHNAVVNNGHVDGSSPLFVACEYERTAEVKLLLEKKAKVEAGPKDQWPLLSSCKRGFFYITEMLLSHGAKVNRMQSDGTTALSTACTKNRVEIVELLLRYKADVNICLRPSSNPLIIACGLAYAGIVKLLLENNANVNAGLITGETPLHLACLSNSTEIANNLVQKGANIDKASASGQTPLHMASSNGNTDIVKLLLDKEAFVDCRVAGGATPLIIACTNNHLSTAKMLLEHNANVNAHDDDGMSAINIAYHYEFNELVRLLLEHNPT